MESKIKVELAKSVDKRIKGKKHRFWSKKAEVNSRD